MHPNSNHHTDDTEVLKSECMVMIDTINKLSLAVRQAEQERTSIIRRLDIVQDYINEILKNIGQLWIKNNT